MGKVGEKAAQVLHCGKKWKGWIREQAVQPLGTPVMSGSGVLPRAMVGPMILQ